MSALTDSIAKRKFLDVCMGIEGLCADLYHYYSKIYEDIPEASSLWEKTALEEENHRKQFELALKLWDETEFEVLNDSLNQACSIHEKLLKLMEQIKNTKPDLLIAVSKAIEMEEKLAGLHAHNSLKFKEESMQNLFKALSDADLDHVADLQRYRSILYLPLSEMEG
jgi:rubrerythrin